MVDNSAPNKILFKYLTAVIFNTNKYVLTQGETYCYFDWHVKKTRKLNFMFKMENKFK